MWSGWMEVIIQTETQETQHGTKPPEGFIRNARGEHMNHLWWPQTDFNKKLADKGDTQNGTWFFTQRKSSTYLDPFSDVVILGGNGVCRCDFFRVNPKDHNCCFLLLETDPVCLAFGPPFRLLGKWRKFSGEILQLVTNTPLKMNMEPRNIPPKRLKIGKLS